MSCILCNRKFLVKNPNEIIHENLEPEVTIEVTDFINHPIKASKNIKKEYKYFIKEFYI